MHCTSGSDSSSLGRFEPQPPPETRELSTGTPRGPAAADADVAALGVCVPGVLGGVNAGESREDGGASPPVSLLLLVLWSRWSGWRREKSVTSSWACLRDLSDGDGWVSAGVERGEQKDGRLPELN